MKRKPSSKEEAIKELGFDPIVMGEQVKRWYLAYTWHGKDKFKKLIHNAEFNLPLLVTHLTEMSKELK